MSNASTLPRWDLTEYYSGVNDPNIEADLAEDLASAIAFEQQYKGRVASLSADELATAIKDYEARSSRPRDPGYYASLMKCLNQNDAAVAALENKVSEKSAEVSAHTLFWELELQKLDKQALAGMYAASPVLARYKSYLDGVLRYRPHTLEDNVEMALQKRSPVALDTVLNRLYDETSEKLRFAFPDALLDEEDRVAIAAREGDKKQEGISQLTDSEIRKYLDSDNEAARQAAYEGWVKTYNDNTYLPTFVMNQLLLDKRIEDKERGYGRSDASRNLGNEVEEQVVDTLAATVKANYPNFSHRLTQLKAKAFGKEKLDAHNEFGPFPDSGKMPTYSWEEARAIVLDSFREFSPKMAAIAEQFFDKGWIDAAPHEGKDGGAFSASNRQSSHPWVLTNFHGTAGDVMTLAHELGHGVHQFLAAQKQGNLLQDTSLTFAETASTFAEMVVFKKLLSQVTTDAERKALLVDKLTAASATVERQIAYHDFENSIHAARNEGELTADDFAEHWSAAHAARTGSQIAFPENDIGNRWGGIPHFFHTPFYVYSYAFGDLLATSLYEKFEQMKAEGKGAEFEDKYLDLLAAASTEHHSEMLPKRFGAEFDLTKPEFWQGGLNVYNGMVEELAQLIEAEKARPQVAQVVHDGTATPAGEKGAQLS